MRVTWPAPLCLALVFSSCAVVDLGAVPEAGAGCTENATEELRQPSAVMLPGYRCVACHTPGGQAGALAWTAAGTIYGSPDDDCNRGGLRDVVVQFFTSSQDPEGSTVMRLLTNRTGNFFTAESVGDQPVRVRVSRDGKTQTMNMSLSPKEGAFDCAKCHRPKNDFGAPSRVYLSL